MDGNYDYGLDMAFQKYSHLDQSLFSRFVRLGVPTIELDMQVRTCTVLYICLWTRCIVFVYLRMYVM